MRFIKLSIKPIKLHLKHSTADAQERKSIMKKSIAIIICLTVIISCLAACGNKTKTKGGEVVTDFGNNAVAVVTEENGGARRDENGNLLVLVTDANGKNVKDENGEYATEAITLKHVVVVGDTVETQYYSIKIPDEWEYNVKSFVDLKFDNAKGDKISITAQPGKTISELMKGNKIIETLDSMYPDSKNINTSVNIAGEDFPFVARYIVKDKESGEGSFVGYIYFSHDDISFVCMVTGARDISSEIENIGAVLSTIQFK